MYARGKKSLAAASGSEKVAGAQRTCFARRGTPLDDTALRRHYQTLAGRTV